MHSYKQYVNCACVCFDAAIFWDRALLEFSQQYSDQVQSMVFDQLWVGVYVEKYTENILNV